jgi:hypothetical protein
MVPKEWVVTAQLKCTSYTIYHGFMGHLGFLSDSKGMGCNSIIIVIITIIKCKRANAGTRDKGTINSNGRIAATMYSLGTYFVSGIYVWRNPA